MNPWKRTFAIALGLGLLAPFTGCSKPDPGSAAVREPERDPDVEAAERARVARVEVLETYALESASAGNRRFSAELYRALSARKEPNLVVSPASLHGALAVAYAGARGETATELARVCGFADDRAENGRRMRSVEARWAAFAERSEVDASRYRRAFEGPDVAPHVVEARVQRHADDLRDSGRVRIASSNRLWLQQGLTTAPDLVGALPSAASPLAFLDLAGDPRGSCAAIVAWMNARTRGFVPASCDPNDLRSHAGIITNVTAFDATWMQPFADTSPIAFRGRGEGSRVPAMRAIKITNLGETPDARVVRWSFGREWPAKATMWFVVPKRRDGLAAIEERLSEDTFDTWARAVDFGARVTLDLSLPSFELAPEPLSLAGELERIGLRHAFVRGEADFSGLDATGQLHLTGVQQITRLRVERHGAVAVSATNLGYTMGEPPPQVELVVDRPFLFYVADRDRNVLFIGRLAAPGEAPLKGPSRSAPSPSEAGESAR